MLLESSRSCNSVKDVICYKDHPLTAASGILKIFFIYSATALKSFTRRSYYHWCLHCDEFAMGSANENSVYKCVDQWMKPVPGGSSGGSL
jgi:aspartyl-tRNA(Asn)/glutamyl-tRNA(Gln) amidotransferase subunit A